MGHIPREFLSLKHFMLKRQVLQLYRDMLRTVKQVPNENDRKELREWIQHDFRQNKSQPNEDSIKALLYSGQRSLAELRKSLSLSK